MSDDRGRRGAPQPPPLRPVAPPPRQRTPPPPPIAGSPSALSASEDLLGVSIVSDDGDAASPTAVVASADGSALTTPADSTGDTADDSTSRSGAHRARAHPAPTRYSSCPGLVSALYAGSAGVHRGVAAAGDALAALRKAEEDYAKAVRKVERMLGASSNDLSGCPGVNAGLGATRTVVGHLAGASETLAQALRGQALEPLRLVGSDVAGRTRAAEGRLRTLDKQYRTTLAAVDKARDKYVRAGRDVDTARRVFVLS
eukprot:TRINITY_DN56893_c0_g1_i1.p1 TRINITY_DN56893_c0_g1~~TRINITY_DN56893_c0_g1_i1.p1  ORF type:complete len:257 (-),score=32.23 TRINITY_DN56893_c0_g1_i1:39-809(-)